MPRVEDTARSDSRTVPPPLRAGLGLVVTGVERAKELPAHLPGHLPRKVSLADLATLPMRGLAFVATARETVERTYEELSNRGETVIARWRHQPEPRQTQPRQTQPKQATQARPAKPAAAVAVAETVEQVVDPFGLSEPVAEAVIDATPGATLSHDQLPLDDYDHLTLGSLRARLAKLDVVALVQLRDYERAHAHRLPVLTMLENRIAKVTTTP
jgi:hypothetical protein